MRRPTIRIVTAEGPITINATDFDAETMEEFTGKAAEPKSGDGDGDGEGQGDGANDPANNQTGTQAPVDPAGGSGQAPTNEEPKDPATMTWPELRSAAAAVSDTAINSKEDALEALRAHAEKTAKAD